MFIARFVGGFLPEVGDMNTLHRCRKAGERNVRYIGLDNQCRASPSVHIRWLTMPRDRTKGIFLAKEEIAELCFANPRGAA